MELHALVWHEWHEDHWLSRRSLMWIRDHAEPGDPNPIVTALLELRRRELELTSDEGAPLP